MSSNPPFTSSGPPTGTPVMPEQSQPVDLATTSKQPLRIPTVPTPTLNPAPRSTGGVAILGGPSGPMRSQQPGPRPLLTVPKATSTAQQVNLAVMNKVTVLTSTPPAKATPLTGANVPRATATTIIRPPTSYPMNKGLGTATPMGGVAGGATSIGLTTATSSQGPSSVQLVPMSLPANIRPQSAGQPVVRPAGMPVNTRGGPSPFRSTPISDAVRVTLVQSPVPSKASLGSAVNVSTTSGNTGFYKQVTITPPNSQKIASAANVSNPSQMRIPNTRMTVLPATPLQTVSLAPTSQQINVPMAPGSRALTSGKIISVPGNATSGPPSSTPQGVTIQKASIPVSQSGPRTISLPYGAATQVAAIAKPVSQAIPVARVCPQPNVVTITTTTGNLVQGAGNSVFIARTSSGSGGSGGQPVAINLSSNQTLNLSKQNTLQQGGAAKISVPAGQQARLVNLPSTAVSTLAQTVQQQAVDQDGGKMVASSPSRPSILRRREGERDNAMPETPPPRPDSRNDDAGSSSSGSTTLSATSSPGITGDREIVSTEDQNLQPSPRKKPRKQQLTSSVRPGSDQQWGEEEEELKRKLAVPKNEAAIPASPPKPAANYIRDKPHMSLLHSYRHTWKSRHNHFLKQSDVRPREDPRPTVNELANQKYIMQKINGWKIYHLTSQMEDIIDMETELTSRLSNLQKKLDKNYLGENSKDLSKVQELIKANLQRSKVIQDQVKESKDHALQVFEHKSRVTDILHKYMSKRPVKKRDVKIMS